MFYKIEPRGFDKVVRMTEKTIICWPHVFVPAHKRSRPQKIQFAFVFKSKDEAERERERDRVSERAPKRKRK
jgi:hypothetical protein